MNYQRLSLANFMGITAKIGNNLCLAAASYLLLNLGASTSAQVIPDNTLPNNSSVNQNGNLIEILEGTTAGSNLFHSFEQFSLIQGETAWFQNATTIDNIITRVTGGSLSSIDGLMRANGTANLFFLNPNGIIFGPNAQLDIGGSFVGTTADSLKFSDGSEFSAIDPQSPPLLTVNINPGLQYGTGNGEIVVQGEGNLLAFNNPVDLIVDRSSRPAGLEVDTGKTLALVGNNIFVEGGNLTAEAGNIELGSVGDNSLVQLNSTDSGWSLDYSEVSNFQDINLSQASSLEVSGNNGGNVQLQGRQVIITDGSAILADTFGDRDGGKLQINASELLVVAGTSENLPFISRLSTDVAPTATGNGGDIELNAGSLIVTGGAQVLSSSYSGGNTGNIKVIAENVELSSGSRIANPSGLFTLVFNSGNGGNLDIETSNISVLDGAEAAALTFDEGKGGNLNVNANHIEVIGTSPGGKSSSFSSNSEGFGDGGNLSINSKFLRIADGGLIQSSVFGSGNGGNLKVNATEVELFGGAPQVGPSGLFATVESEATGNSGKLYINAQFLSITDGAQAAVTTFGEGNAGILDVKADNIELIGASPGGSASALFSNVETTAIGKGGLINVETKNLKITDGARIAAITFGSGLGGSIKIQAEEIELSGNSSLASSGLFTTVRPQAEGNGGNLIIDTDSLTVKEGAQIAVSTAGSGNGGELNLSADKIELIGAAEFGASGIFGNAIIGDGNGGNISVTTDDLTIRDGATINVSNFFSGNANVPPGTAKAGNIHINAQNIELDGVDSSITATTFDGGGGNITLDSKTITAKNGAQVTAETSGAGDGGSITISANEFNLNNQAEVSVNSTGQGQAGDIAITSDNLTLDEGRITATSELTGGGNINLVSDFIALDHNSLISTSVLDSTGGGGNITINSDYIIANNNSDLKADADEGPGGNITITTKALFFSPDSEITASSDFGVDGVVEIDNPNGDEQIGVPPLKSEIVNPAGIISSFCATDSTDKMIISGKGGLGENPSQNLRGQSVWEDLRDFTLASNDNNAISPPESQEYNQNSETIIEANNWVVNDQGKVELVSHIPTSFNQCKK
ncbi:MAG: filamentous hemagglutinin N-terminal domain-containing protein [Xenococcus sp. MO_188.B8]|nr:filamentous hemagglutinin N-terminal domain-containing protein [Xenococcus sp. MO_188.B8]